MIYACFVCVLQKDPQDFETDFFLFKFQCRCDIILFFLLAVCFHQDSITWYVFGPNPDWMLLFFSVISYKYLFFCQIFLMFVFINNDTRVASCKKPHEEMWVFFLFCFVNEDKLILHVPALM